MICERCGQKTSHAICTNCGYINEEPESSGSTSSFAGVQQKDDSLKDYSMVETLKNWKKTPMGIIFIIFLVMAVPSLVVLCLAMLGGVIATLFRFPILLPIYVFGFGAFAASAGFVQDAITIVTSIYLKKKNYNTVRLALDDESTNWSRGIIYNAAIIAQSKAKFILYCVRAALNCFFIRMATFTILAVFTAALGFVLSFMCPNLESAFGYNMELMFTFPMWLILLGIILVTVIAVLPLVLIDVILNKIIKR